MILALWRGPQVGQAVIFYTTSDPAYNATEPTGSLTNSGWQYEGNWNSFLGTAIAPRYFITAKHVGGVVGEAFTLNGKSYVTTDYFDHPTNDLRIWRVRTPLPVAAELYPRTDEPGKSVVVIGRGTQRGEALLVASLYGHEAKGWLWGVFDGVKRWGENRVISIYQDPTTRAECLRMSFDAGGGPNESTLSTGDSGGALFIQDGGVWKLAGINYAVDGPFNTNTTGAGFFAAVYDRGGLYEGGADKWSLTSEFLIRQPGNFFSTRISTSREWIASILALPLPADAPNLFASDSLAGPFSMVTNAVVDPNAMTIRVPAPSNTRFFLLQDTSQRRIQSISTDGDRLLIRY